MDTKILSPLEEAAILDTLADEYNNLELSTGGSSRLVYALPTRQMKELCSLIGIPYREYVIKVVLGRGGKNQMNNEISAWNAYSNFLKLVPIAAYGKYVEIMERVTPFDDEDYNEGFDLSEDDAWSAAEANDVWGFAYWSFFRGWYHQLINAAELWSTMSDSYSDLCHQFYDKYHPPVDADNNLKFIGRDVEKKMSREEYHEAVLTTRNYAFDMGWLEEGDFEKALDMSKQFMDAYNDLQAELGDTADNCQFGRNMNTGEIQCYDYGFRGDGWKETHAWDSPIGDWETGFEYGMYFYDLKMSLLHPSQISLESIEKLWNTREKR